MQKFSTKICVVVTQRDLSFDHPKQLFKLMDKKIFTILRPKILGNLGLYMQGSHRLEKYLNLEDFLEKSLKIKSALKSTGKSLKNLEKSLNSTIFCRT